MTRHKARSTFTFEVKRAAKRTPEVVTLQRTPASAGSSLADQVFGRFSPSPSEPRKPRRAKPAAEPVDSLFSFLDALPDDDEIPAPAVRPEPVATPVAADGAEPAGRPKPSPRAGRRSLKALAMRAERKGGEPPRLPAGQRWKRRLPKACW
jgi:hypothetical protein